MSQVNYFETPNGTDYSGSSSSSSNPESLMLNDSELVAIRGVRATPRPRQLDAPSVLRVDVQAVANEGSTTAVGQSQLTTERSLERSRRRIRHVVFDSSNGTQLYAAEVPPTHSGAARDLNGVSFGDFLDCPDRQTQNQTSRIVPARTVTSDHMIGQRLRIRDPPPLLPLDLSRRESPLEPTTCPIIINDASGHSSLCGTERRHLSLPTVPPTGSVFQPNGTTQPLSFDPIAHGDLHQQPPESGPDVARYYYSMMSAAEMETLRTDLDASRHENVRNIASSSLANVENYHLHALLMAMRGRNQNLQIEMRTLQTQLDTWKLRANYYCTLFQQSLKNLQFGNPEGPATNMGDAANTEDFNDNGAVDGHSMVHPSP